MPCPRRKAAAPTSHRGWTQPARTKITAAVLNVTKSPATSLWRYHKAHQREDQSITSVAPMEIKILHESPGGPVLGYQNDLHYRGESEQASVFGQETYPKFIHERKAE